MLTSRMKKVIRILLKNEDYITIASVASEVEVSTRTILRELDDIQMWVEKNGGFVEKKKGRGLKFIPGTADADTLKELLVQAKGEIIYTPEDRRVIIRAKLLEFDEPTKLFALTRLLNVTESTVGNDLDHLEAWFNNYNLLIVKKPGLGIIIKGSENAKRKAIVALIYEHFHMNELIQVISKRTTNTNEFNGLENLINSAILDLMDVAVVGDVRSFILAFEKEMGYQFADNGYIALAIRFGVTLKRSKFWGEIEVPEKLLESLPKDKVMKFFNKYLRENPDHPLNQLPYKELANLSMHVKGTKLRDTGDYNKISMIEDFKVIQLVKEFIERTETETGVYLSDNEQLMIGLLKHLRPSIYRIKMDLDIINPLVEEIKTMYPKLFKAVKRSVQVIEEKENIEVPDDEIAYLATHIGALIHKNNRRQVKKYRVVVACMFGIGASSFLVAQIKKNFPNIVIKEVVSVMDEQIMSLDEDQVDMLITTVPLSEVNVPYVMIDPILKPKDIQTINDKLDSLVPSSSIGPGKRKANLKERLLALNEYGNLIIKLMDNFKHSTEENMHTIMDMIDFVSSDLSETTKERMDLSKAFIQREEKGSTILSKKGMILLHCRAEISKELALRIIHVEKPMFIQKEGNKVPVSDIVVMVAPVVLNQKMLEILSEISRHIITEGFSDVIQSADSIQIESKLSLILEKFYENRVLEEPS